MKEKRAIKKPSAKEQRAIKKTTSVKKPRTIKKTSTKEPRTIKKTSKTTGDIFVNPNIRYDANYNYSHNIPFKDINVYGNVVGKLGEGSYGSVVKTKTKDGKEYAIKRGSQVDPKDATYPTPDILVEVSTIIRFKHPNIVNLIDLLTIKELNMYRTGIVLPVAVSDLRTQHIPPEYQARINPNELAYQALSGLSYMHANYTIHRDLKPDNILLMSDLTIKISDFGSAKAYACNPSADFTDKITTLWYRPPEILLGTNKYGLAVDIWSMGCILFELYTKQVLFKGDDDSTQLLAIFKILGTPGRKGPWPDALHLPGWLLSTPKFKSDKRAKILDPLRDAGYANVYKIILALLTYDPKDRPSVSKILSDPYWNSIRIKKNEYSSPPCSISIQKRERYPNKPNLNTLNLTVKMRQILIEWLSDVSRMFKLHEKTLLLTIQFIDETVSIVKPTKETLQLLGISCLSISANLIEIYSPDLNDYAYITDGAYTILEINDTRGKILSALGYDLVVTTAIDYEHEFDDRNISNEVKALNRGLLSIIYLHTDLPYSYMPHELFNVSATISESLVGISSHKSDKNIIDITVSKLTTLLSRNIVNIHAFKYYSKSRDVSISWDTFKELFSARYIK